MCRQEKCLHDFRESYTSVSDILHNIVLITQTNCKNSCAKPKKKKKLLIPKKVKNKELKISTAKLLYRCSFSRQLPEFVKSYDNDRQPQLKVAKTFSPHFSQTIRLFFAFYFGVHN